MIEINWANYKSKFYGKERSEFELLSYMLFCYEFNIRVGIFRFKNQTGIETEPIVVEGTSIGFQAKYFDTKVDKNEIITSLTKAKTKNPMLSKILLYTNQELSESSDKSKKKPQLQTDIERTAADLNIALEWRVPSHFEKMLSVPENSYLVQYFFSLENGVINFLEKMDAHSANILGAIQTSIQFENRAIKIDRSESLAKLHQSNSQILILSGDGGSGKTALIKELFQDTWVPCYVLKAAEFSKLSLTEIFNQFGPFDMVDFLRFHSDEGKKIFVIDSAEKLADLTSTDVFIGFLSALIADAWTVTFTTRNSFLDDLCYQMLEIYRSSFNVIKIENLSLESLQKLADDFEFKLPTDSRLQTLICNLFYLKEYLANYRAINEKIDVTAFRDILWKKKIQNSQYRKNNTHLEREKCFLSLAKERCNSGRFFLNGERCDSSVLSLLDNDEVIKYEPTQSSYFITHDIYEEWALEKLIDNEFALFTSCDSFFAGIGSSLPVRRAFRSWLSGKLYQIEPDTRIFIEQAFSSNTVLQFWKDELLISILLSEYSFAFFKTLDSVLIENNKFLLKRIVFLMRTACKEVDNEWHKILRLTNEKIASPEYVFTKPKGEGWKVIIQYLRSNIDTIQKDELPIILPFLKDWLTQQRRGVTTREAGVIALHFYKHSELNDDVYYGSEIEKTLLQLVLFAAAELKPELVEITNGLQHPLISKSQPFESLRETILTNIDDSFTYIANLPAMTIRMADAAWYKNEKEKNDEYDNEAEFFYSSGIGVEDYYAINPHWHHEYSPASALQTPVYQLLMFALRQTIDFILDFTNRTVESYFKSGRDSAVHEIDVVVGEKRTKQIISGSLWSMYRGCGSPVTPYLLQSIHMALEKRLLDIAKMPDKLVIQGWLIYLLENTCSASITAVVTSVVLAYPDDLFDIAKILFHNYEFFKYDNQRLVSESQAKGIYAIGRGLDYRTKKYEDERMATCEQPHRKTSLENLALNYQFFRNEPITEEQVEQRQKEIWNIIDEFHAKIPENTTDDKQIITRLLLARIDRRKMNPTVERQENGFIINFNPELAPDLKEYSQQALQSYNGLYEHTKLNLWAKDKVEGQARYGPYKEYDENPELVLKETKEIVEKLQAADDESFRSFNSSIPSYACSALIKHYSSGFSKDDLLYCKNIVLNYAVAPLQEYYGYQIADGVEASVSALPSLYGLFPEEKNKYNFILLLLLFDEYAIGAYKRICDYSIEAINSLFIASPENANAVLFGYMMLKPKFNKENPPLAWAQSPKSHAEILSEFITTHETELANLTHDISHYRALDFDTQDIRTAETAFQIMPADTVDETHLDYIQKLLQKYGKELLKRTKYDYKEEIDHYLKHRLFKKYARFLLYRETTNVEIWAALFVDVFRITEEMANLISEIVSAEDELGKYETFWKAWECFYPVIRTAVQKGRERDLDTIIKNYLLAWPWWKETAKEWRSLREREKIFFKTAIGEMGEHPAVLYSIARLLNEIGSPFLEDGILWITQMLKEHKNLSVEELEPNTIYFLEKAIRKYVYLNRTKLKTSQLMKDNVLVLLDFLVNKGSVNGYLLREDVY